MNDPTHTAEVVCLACGKNLKSEMAKTSSDELIDNVLWLGFFGGYGDFVDNYEATIPINTEDQWLRGEDGEYIVTDGNLVDDPAWKPIYNEPRLLPGTPDHEAVICHECAHKLCDTVPWIKKLLDPDNSHACTF